MTAGSAGRLATIVAVDAAGYSHQSEVDETVAVREITALRERVEECASRHGGRVFNTAGDGFMLEFSAASSALGCAEELLTASRVPLRIGIHLGEVFEGAGGDLLGRGVNVAARLRELAEPGALRVSGDFKNALPAPLDLRLASRGAVRLGKMDARIDTFAIAGAWRARPWRALLQSRRRVLAAAAVLAAAGLAAVGAAASRLVLPVNERVAVLDFATDGEATLERFSDALSSQIVGTMSVNDLQAIPHAGSEEFRAAGLGPSARRIGAGFVLDGAVRQEGETLAVNVQLVDARSNVTLWSNDFRRAAAEGAAMQEQLAARVTDILRCALISRRPRAGPIDRETLALFLRTCDRMQRYDQGPEEMHEAARQIVERAPRFSRGWSMLAMASALAARRAPPQRAEALREEAESAAARARGLDRRNAESDLALSLILPEQAWREREALLQRALASEPDLPEAHIFRGDFLAEVGRLREALPHYRRAVALDPLSPLPWAAMLPALSATGQLEEAGALRARLYRVWPDSASVWYNRFNNAVFAGQASEALATLNNEDSPLAIEQPVREAWRSFLTAHRAGDRRALRAAVERIAEMARRSEFDMPRAISTASLVGELDIGFDLANAYYVGGVGTVAVGRDPVAGGHRSFLFLRPGTPMRRDPRFIALARGRGLVDYWTRSGIWPDYCAQPDLPYDCRAVAARLG